jgi:hypothetical protein
VSAGYDLALTIGPYQVLWLQPYVPGEAP